jgi:hypothetical protein
MSAECRRRDQLRIARVTRFCDGAGGCDDGRDGVAFLICGVDEWM